MGNSHKNQPVAQLEPNFDGIVIGWSFSKIVSGSHALPPRWPPQCSCVVIESSFDPGERLQAPIFFFFCAIALQSIKLELPPFFSSPDPKGQGSYCHH